jgi:hypothetical protein
MNIKDLDHAHIDIQLKDMISTLHAYLLDKGTQSYIPDLITQSYLLDRITQSYLHIRIFKIEYQHCMHIIQIRSHSNIF